MTKAAIADKFIETCQIFGVECHHIFVSTYESLAGPPDIVTITCHWTWDPKDTVQRTKIFAQWRQEMRAIGLAVINIYGTYESPVEAVVCQI